MHASSLNKSSSQEGLKNCPFCGPQQRVYLNEPNEYHRYGSINCPACLVVMPGAVSDQAELVQCWNTRHPSFNEAIEAAAKAAEDQTWTLPLYPPEENINVAVGEAANIVLRQVAESIRSLKLPDYRGGEAKTAESGDSPSTLNAETE